MQILASTQRSLCSQADLNCNIQDDTGSFYGVTSQYESSENMTITCSTKVCSFGKQVVEKVEVRTQVLSIRADCCLCAAFPSRCIVSFPQTEYARFENGRFVYRISRSPMCEYMINFIHKLKHLPEKYMMNSVLENFTILLVIRSLTWSLTGITLLVAVMGGSSQLKRWGGSCWCCIALIPQGMRPSVRNLIIYRRETRSLGVICW